MSSTTSEQRTAWRPEPRPSVEYPSHGDPPLTDTDVQRLEREAVSQLLIDLLRPRPDVYAAADLFVYYEEGRPEKKLAPDVFVCFGVPAGNRDVYLTWQEGHGVDFALEIVSKGTWRRDLLEKPVLYGQRLGTSEYYVFDPQGLYLPEPLMAFDLREGTSIGREPSAAGRFASPLLGLDLGLERAPAQERGVRQAWELHFYRPDGGRLLRPREALHAAEQAARAAEERANQEGRRREELEEELRQAREEIARLRKASAGQD
jgi:Uma2 family endonuclease